MHKLALAAVVAALSASPAYATGGMTCRTGGPRPVEVSVGFGHVPGAPIILSRLKDNGRSIAVTAPQWWLDNDELRLVLVNRNGTRREAIIKTKRNGLVYDGSLWRNGQRRWVRCREA